MALSLWYIREMWKYKENVSATAGSEYQGEHGV